MQTSIHDSIIGLVKAEFDIAYPTLAIAYPNAPFDWNNPPAEFVAIDIEFMTGYQVGISSNPKRRVGGAVYVTAYKRIGTGCRTSLQALDWFSTLLKFRHVGIANLETPVPGGSGERRGYATETLRVTFFSDPA